MTDTATAPSTADALSREATREAYQQLLDHMREAALLGSTAALLSWDQQTIMPRGGLALRSQQRAQLARMIHERRTAPQVGEWLATCEADPEIADALTGDEPTLAAANVREWRRGYDRDVKLPTDLVEAISKATSTGNATWEQARADADFAAFQGPLAELIGLKRQVAECYGWGDDGEAWDALADGFEPGSTAKGVEAVFVPLRERLVALLDRLRGGTPPDRRFRDAALPIDGQARFCRQVVGVLGFDFRRGRLDTSTHPFCGGTHCNDVRMTTRFKATDIADALGSSMHECGHALYEQGLPEAHIGTPLGSAVSLGIHESQSRMWENQVGRSRAFWEYAGPLIKAAFTDAPGDPLGDLTVDDFYGAVNLVEPGFIRVEADEATYNLHVMLRFELERALIGGSLDAADVPGAWNDAMRDYLGVEVPNDAQGCLQDVHWSYGAFGYFPTYTLGNLYCAQLFEAAGAALGDLDAQFARGECAPLLTWLREQVHAHGRRYTADQLCAKVTGKPLSSEPLLRHLEGKLAPLYGV